MSVSTAISIFLSTWLLIIAIQYNFNFTRWLLSIVVGQNDTNKSSVSGQLDSC